ncbi:MAG TPA: hypothetical protein VKF61_08215, partial [Candidatus Polarisedimenticolia bacterium]|nr:hypothetical protein [Candidatus Polarisedimenticolia bacterium]
MDRKGGPAGLAAALLVFALTLPGVAALACASALKEPRPLGDLAGAPPGEAAPVRPGEAATLVSNAAALFAERDVEKAKQASQMFLRAAAAENAPIDALLGAVQAQIWLIEHEPEARAREEGARTAVEAAQWCGREAPLDPRCDYWLGAALGVQAREKPSTALSALPKIEALFRRAAEAQPTIDEGGPDRALALLYLRAPGWPSGPGDPDLGLRHARTAAQLRPDFPPNHLALGEALSTGGGA